LTPSRAVVMISGRDEGLKSSEPPKADSEWASVARPGGKGIARRNHEAPLFPWNGRAKRLNQVFGSIPCRGDSAGRPRARRFLRKASEASRKRAHPTDAFCAQCPCPRATTQAFWKCRSATGDFPQTSPPFEKGGREGFLGRPFQYAKVLRSMTSRF
jgi:hypothetical protein